MHVVHLTNAYAPASGGVRTMLHALGEGYAPHGHRLTAVVPAASRGVDHEPWGVRVRLPGPRVPGTAGYRVLLDAAAVRRTLDQLAPDRVEVSDRFTLRHVGAWSRAHGVPSVLFAHERLDGLARTLAHLPASTARAAADVANRRWAASFDRIVVTTAYGGEELDRIGVPTVRVPLGVDLDVFHPGARTRGPAGPDVVLALCSRLSPEKKPHTAVATLALLRAEGVDARLVVLGDGPEASRLRRLAADLPVTFLGHVEDRRAVARTLADADVTLAPGPLETFGLAAAESLACGTPVVAARGSAVAGLAAQASEPGEFARRVVELVGAGGSARAAARARAERLGWATTVRSLLRLHGAPARDAPAMSG
ncbi:glycosyltransferase [Cellulomonas oligotrophica]|uniref:D-inositol 3-phosphate glycosyltransferase n=1 Tax=Cellulomonas oligotrophica TaxID=931536 RepID=A0A7Y9FIN1_9CELL|nr:glycosyltransferase [Cellulomonas oligotrophica]NYD88005.1 alpha-1,6-mannosyltransferase [Cellulomonas oligotrophica]GIG34499.1 GDP-mannose-dependent alpha-(1-6)-phosphatidylinositol dimannoside mannosyltransferase [Cellulomonas oligotrophica]